MKQLVYSSDHVRVEYLEDKKVIIATWKQVIGPEFRKGVQAGLDYVAERGVTSWIADVSAVTTTPVQADQEWIASYVSPALLKAGLRRLINVLPESAVVRMGAKRWSKSTANSDQSEAINVSSLSEALEAA